MSPRSGPGGPRSSPRGAKTAPGAAPEPLQRPQGSLREQERRPEASREPFWLIVHSFLDVFRRSFYDAFSSFFFECFSLAFGHFFAPRANGRHAKIATPSMRKPVFSRCALAPAPPGRRRKIHKKQPKTCLLYTSPSPRDGLLSRMPSSA